MNGVHVRELSPHTYPVKQTQAKRPTTRPLINNNNYSSFVAAPVIRGECELLPHREERILGRHKSGGLDITYVPVGKLKSRGQGAGNCFPTLVCSSSWTGRCYHGKGIIATGT